MKSLPILLKTSLLALTALSFTAAPTLASSFDWENLQSDIHGVGERTDSHLINPWGIAVSPSGAFWVNDNGQGVATVYNGNGAPLPNSTNPLVVQIPPSASNSGGSNPTGIAANNTSFFKVTKGANSQPAKFIFVSEDGMISGWNPALDNTHALVARDNGPSAVYKGATLGVSNGHNFLFVTNFASGKVETYDENFNPVNPTGFVDPNLPAGYSPFGIAQFNGQVFVTFAKRNPSNPNDDLAGAGFGYVDVFNTKGQFVRRLVSNGRLNAPWGLSLIQGALWVGNFGDGQINVYNPTNGSFLGVPKDVFNNALVFDGLWGLYFYNGELFFTAGIADEEHGIFGVIFTQ